MTGIAKIDVAIDFAMLLQFVTDLQQIVYAKGGWLIHRLGNGFRFRLTRLQ